jgi:hypothetical protein
LKEQAVSTITPIAPRRRKALAGRGTDPTRPATSVSQRSGYAAAADRQHEQLPTFVPVLEEVELDGWSSHPHALSGNFHDWMLLGGRRILVMVGQAAGQEPCDPIETALVAQATWTALRAHAQHTDDAGRLLSLAARTLWTNPTMHQQASVAVALVDSVGGSASLAIAGDALACRVRAATWEQLPGEQPPLGAETKFDYAAHEFALSLRERLLLVADHPDYRPTRMAASLAAEFAQLNAESHRRMTATDTLSIARRRYEREAHNSPLASASIVALRRR